MSELVRRVSRAAVSGVALLALAACGPGPAPTRDVVEVSPNAIVIQLPDPEVRLTASRLEVGGVGWSLNGYFVSCASSGPLDTTAVVLDVNGRYADSGDTSASTLLTDPGWYELSCVGFTRDGGARKTLEIRVPYPYEKQL